MSIPSVIEPLMEMCRTCMGENESYFNSPPRRRRKTSDLISIFNEPQSIEEGVTIMELLQLTVPRLTIGADDMLPKKMCAYCVDNLMTIQEFQNMCIRVQQRFIEIIKGDNETEGNKIDPLNGSCNKMHIDDYSNVLKIEMDDSLVDDNASQINERTVEVCKTEDDADSCNDDGNDPDYEWEPNIDKVNRKRKYTGPDKANPDSGDFPVLETSQIENFEDNKPFACEECGSRLKTRKSLKRHQRIHLRESDEKEHKCQQCNRVFQKLSSLKNHLKSHRENYAEINDYTESSNDDLENADSEWEPQVDNIASESHKWTNTVGEIDEESKDVRNYPATEATQKGDLEIKPFVCRQCGSRLKTRKSLKRHLRIHLRQPGEKEITKAKYECEHCNKVFQQSSSLKDHLRIHTGEQPYLCSECGKAFKSLSNMKQHFLRHGTDRPYECPDCPKKFPCLSDLASHKAVHSKSKTHVCDVCGAGFVKPYLLKKHKMYHNGEKNHKCDYCEMRFVLADQCRRHMRTHTGEKPYKCKYCVRAFAQSNDLIKHLRGHLGDNVYKCDMCPQGFRLQGDLRTHFNTHKNDDDETRLRNLQALKDDELRIQMKFGLVQANEQQ